MSVSVVLERCADCSRICLCHGECACMTIEATSADVLCHDCTDVRDVA